MENFKYIWIMVGLPASGKSTKIKELFHNYKDVDILSSDAIIEKWCAEEGITYNEGFSKYIDLATAEFFNQFRKSLILGRSIVIDRTNLTKKSRSKFLSQLPKSYKKIAINVECYDEYEYNHRLNSRSGKVIPEKVIEQMKSTFEMPSLEEGFDDIVHFDTTNYN